MNSIETIDHSERTADIDPSCDPVRYEDLHVEDLLEGGKGMCLLPNDWPYNVPYGVRHSILWTSVSRTVRG